MEEQCLIEVTAFQYPEFRQGKLRFIRISDCSYVIHFGFVVNNCTADKNNSPESCSVVSFEDKEVKNSKECLDEPYLLDMDVVEIDPDLNMVKSLMEEIPLQLIINDQVSFDCFHSIYDNCSKSCELYFNLYGLLSDVYFSGFNEKTNVSMNNRQPRLIKEINKLHKDKSLSNQILANSIATNTQIVDTGKKIFCSITSASDVVCIYCNTVMSNRIHQNQNFVIHPYVPKRNNGKPIFICGSCVENWKEYRDNAERMNLLLLANEINEEICAICSDMPDTLILCSKCVRSYCHRCISSSMEPKEWELFSKDMDRDLDWNCMCCVHGVPDTVVTSRNAWKPARQLLIDDNKTGNALVKDTTTHQSIVSNPMMTPTFKEMNKSPSNQIPMNEDLTILRINSNQKSANGMSSPISRSPRHPFSPQTSTVQDNMSTASTTPIKPLRMHSSLQSAKQEVSPNERHSPRILKNNTETTTTNNSIDRKDRPGMKIQRTKSKESDQNSSATSTSISKLRTRTQTPRSNLDERYYFSQYVNYYDQTVRNYLDVERQSGTSGSKRSSCKWITDDTCFLCKDGGDLLECDWKPYNYPGNNNFERCTKVYHSSCLGFDIDDCMKSKWCCPRHFCDICGCIEVKYICRYCPASICFNCIEQNIEKFGRYAELEIPPGNRGMEYGKHPGNVIVIACKGCLELIGKCNRVGDLLKVNPLDSKYETMTHSIYEDGGLSNEITQMIKIKGKKFIKPPPNEMMTNDDTTGRMVRRVDSIPLQESDKNTKHLKKRSFPQFNSDEYVVDYKSIGVSINHRWSEKELKKLKEGIAQYGTNVDLIMKDEEYKKFFENRNKESIATKIFRMKE